MLAISNICKEAFFVCGLVTQVGQHISFVRVYFTPFVVRVSKSYNRIHILLAQTLTEMGLTDKASVQCGRDYVGLWKCCHRRSEQRWQV